MRSSSRVVPVALLRHVILLAIATGSPGICLGALAWQNPTVELKTEVEATQATAVFHFKNEGAGPVTITDVKPSCGCTTVELAKRTYGPDESGDIKLLYTLGGAYGVQQKTLAVTTSDAPQQPVTLTMHVTIPELLTISWRLFIWRVNEDPAEKSATITSLKELTGIEPAPGAPATAAWRIETIEAGRKYRISVRPKSTAEPLSVQLPFVARLADKTTRPLTLFVLVR